MEAVCPKRHVMLFCSIQDFGEEAAIAYPPRSAFGREAAKACFLKSNTIGLFCCHHNLKLCFWGCKQLLCYHVTRCYRLGDTKRSVLYFQEVRVALYLDQRHTGCTLCLAGSPTALSKLPWSLDGTFCPAPWRVVHPTPQYNSQHTMLQLE